MLTIGRSSENVVHPPGAIEVLPPDSLETGGLDWMDIFRPLHAISEESG